mgnify:FL=1
MSNVIIKNDFLTVEIETMGAQIKSVKNNSNLNLLWSGDEYIWKDRAPVLFPICGKLKDDKYIINSKEYTLSAHGYACSKEFEIESSDNTSVTFLHKSDEKTKEHFPFSYEFRVIYSLTGSKLHIRYNTKNLSNETMYFSVGAHEGYYCPEGIENYTIIFEKKETLKSFIVNNSLLENNTIDILTDSNILPLKYDYFKYDSLVFKYISSNSLSLINNSNHKKITINFNGFDFLVLWSLPDAKFICIEPWCGIPDSVASNYDITAKEGIIKLSANKTHEVIHTIVFEQ